MIVPSASSAENATVSDSVGCGWTLSAMSSESAPGEGTKVHLRIPA